VHILPPAHPLGGAKDWFGLVCSIVFNDNLNIISVISCWSVLLVEETGVPGENHIPVTDKLYHIIVSSTPGHHDFSGNSH
jgi:hypothetical protein